MDHVSPVAESIRGGPNLCVCTYVWTWMVLVFWAREVIWWLELQLSGRSSQLRDHRNSAGALFPGQ